MKKNELNLLLEEIIARDFTLDEAWEIINELKLLKQRKEKLQKNYNIPHLRTIEDTWYRTRLNNCYKIFDSYHLNYKPEDLIKE